MRDFEHVRAEKCEVDNDEKCSDWQSSSSWPVPSSPCDHVKQDGSDQHGRRDRYAVRCREITRCSETEHKRDACNHQSPIHYWHINLPDNSLRGIDGPQTRAVSELDGLHR